MARIDVGDNYGQVADRIENNYAGPLSIAPPDDHPNGRECPQCGELTWRLTQHCRCCGIDLFALDRELRQQKGLRRKLVMISVLMVVSFVAIFGQQYAPANWRFGVSIFGLSALMAAAALTKS